MNHVSNEIVIILLCLFQRVFMRLKKPQSSKVTEGEKRAESNRSSTQSNTELTDLIAQKKEIQSTIEEFNTPSTFAKYSKMKRELIKIDSRIKQLRQSQGSQNTSEGTQASTDQKVIPEKQKTLENLLPSWFGLFFNIVIMCLALTLSTNVLPHHSEIPLNAITDENGKANCIFVYLACKMIMN